MILFYSQNSPYARIARVALRESGLLGQVEEIHAANREPGNPVLAHSPVGRVPALVDGDLVITEARWVYQYFAERAPQSGLSVATGWKAVAREGQILGFLEGIAFWVREMRRDEPDRSKFLIGVEVDRGRRCLQRFEREVAALPKFPAFDAIALGAALSLMELHKFFPDWQQTYPALAAWYARLEAQASMLATAPV